MPGLFQILSNFFDWWFLIYATVILSSYLILGVFSAQQLRHYLLKNNFVDYDRLISSPLMPTVSIIAPAYNEGLTIVENTRSLLSLHYVNYEVIIVNDGSKDDCLEKLISSYDLRKVAFASAKVIATQPIRGVYKSNNPAFSKLVVVDKENGGKADALNVGLNVSRSKLVACIDVDCLLEQDSLLKMVKPFLTATRRKVIATGGVIRIANSCKVEDGKLVEVNLPKSLMLQFQVIEYIRAFILGRMAWSRLDGLLLISGAFGVFDREIAAEAGGYDHGTVGEDMELVVRMRRLMEDKKIPYRVVFIPDPLCWTEAPDTHKILGNQRNRWTRGTIETLLIHKQLFFNPRYKRMGMLSYPYWFFFEWMAPLLEAAGILYFILLVCFGSVNWLVVLSLFGGIYAFAVAYSFFALLSEELTYHQYRNSKDIIRLMFASLLEPLLFHPVMVYHAVRGNLDFVTGKNKGWGEMVRTGFKKEA